ncbi:DUF5336 domain-containing protein [Actinokineospora iranica]|uniref:Uncharacterized protein n=1 Tax=Actinokineospora iranica TaxID=1271860 RepID=A0A1G6SKP1_9PSEU|nr:DUF5336 domain-containing protein [Actinokineospora iranica]SDD16686.1 hypothetical protein SAMN05216174_1085 [Actinokineospora iranica]
MTYPGGAPGGYPGPGPQQPPQGFGPPPTAGGGGKLGLAQILHLAVAGLGTLNLFLGFAPLAIERSFYESFTGWVPGLLFVGGLFALPAILPGEKKVGIASAAVTLGVTLAFLFTVFAADGELKAGGIMVLIFGILQAVAAVAAFLFEAGIVKPPQPGAQQHGHFGQPGGYNPQSSQFPQPQYGQPQPPPQSGQQTTFAPQQGQFGQQPPGTPPGGYPQQPQG